VCSGVQTTTIIIATLGAAAVVGICIAVVACLALSGGASYAAYNKLGNDGEASVHNSPLYEANDKGGDNLLYDPNK